MTRMPFSRAVAIAAVLAVTTMTLLPGAAGAEERPMIGIWKGNAHVKPADEPDYLINNETGAGVATNLHKFSWSSVEKVYAKFFPQFISVEGEFTMTALNGDTVFGTYSTTG